MVLTSSDILLIRKNQQQRVLHLAIQDNPLQLLPRLIHPIPIVRVHHEYQALRAGEVVSPEGPDFVLPADVPDVEFGVFVGDGFDVEADRWDRGDVRVEFEFVEDGCEGVWWLVGSQMVIPCMVLGERRYLPIPDSKGPDPCILQESLRRQPVRAFHPDASLRTPSPPDQQDEGKK